MEERHSLRKQFLFILNYGTYVCWWVSCCCGREEGAPRAAQFLRKERSCEHIPLIRGQAGQLPVGFVVGGWGNPLFNVVLVKTWHRYFGQGSKGKLRKFLNTYSKVWAYFLISCLILIWSTKIQFWGVLPVDQDFTLIIAHIDVSV